MIFEIRLHLNEFTLFYRLPSVKIIGARNDVLKRLTNLLQCCILFLGSVV